MTNNIDRSKGKYWDEPLNVFTGCSPVDEPGDPCAHCWAHGFVDRLGGAQGDFTPTFHRDRLDKHLGKKRPRIYFCNNTGDWLHTAFTDDQIRQFLLALEDAPEHAYLTLTKRTRRLVDIYTDLIGDLRIPNLWLGATVWDQRSAEVNIERLGLLPGHTWISYEPMLGNIRLSDSLWYGVEWCTLGAETGRNRRPANAEWFESAIDQCTRLRVPVWVKAFPKGDGITHKLDEMPAWARRREMPPELEAIARRPA